MSAAPDTLASNKPTMYSADANDAIQLRIVFPAYVNHKSAVVASNDKNGVDEDNYIFSPTFTYSLFGKDQIITGYKSPLLDIRFSCASLHVYLGFTYEDYRSSDHQLNPDEVAVHQPVQELMTLLPKDTCLTLNDFNTLVKKDEKFMPPGIKVHQYEIEEDNVAELFELYQCTWMTPGFKPLYDRLKILPVLLIEAAEALPTDDHDWDFLVLFGKRQDGQYYFIGICAAYSFYLFPDQKRKRISQFFILPPYQGQGHGRELYQCAYTAVVGDNSIGQFAIEDPSYVFDTLRDCCDLEWLLDHGGVNAIRELPPVQSQLRKSGLETTYKIENTATGDTIVVPRSTQEMATHLVKMAKLCGLRKWMKLSKRQSERIYEMALLKALKGIPNKKYRLMVKARIYRANKEGLQGISKAERVRSLDLTYRSVLDEYRMILSKMC